MSTRPDHDVTRSSIRGNSHTPRFGLGAGSVPDFGTVSSGVLQPISDDHEAPVTGLLAIAAANLASG
ncbi:hypothetical protein GCM10009539_50140 [Cryptosporangium japonicum]|uniref:Uncharacterized protein n=1 Tax=Cryptosporangium japonicum TaxID=80872 RepID=A0ABN0URA6_9ACTN